MLDSTIAYGLNFLFPAKDRAVGASLRASGEFARSELDFLVAMASSETGTYLDVGANVGAIALPFAAQRRRWRVVALEAHRGLSGILNANVLNNRLFNVEVMHAAAGAARRVDEFANTPLSAEMNFGELGFHMHSAGREPVAMLPLDEIAPADTAIVKIDVEGFELEVLRGAQALIAARRAVWLIEATAEPSAKNAAIVTSFQDAGYSLFWFFAPFVTFASPKGRPADPWRGDPNLVALPPRLANSWDLAPVRSPNEPRPGDLSSYSYLRRYGYG